MRADAFSLGNILIFVENGDYEIEVSPENGINLTGYAYHISSRKKKSYICLFGVWFDNKLLVNLAITGRSTCPHVVSDLDEVGIGTISYPMLFICRRCGQLLTCSCFDGYFSVQDDIVCRLPYGNSEIGLREHVERIQIKDNICHLCSGEVPRLVYGSDMYYSSFLQRYLPYHTLLSRKQFSRTLYEGDDFKHLENELRETFGYPKIGERWISETMLFKIVSMLFSPKEVIHHHRGRELQGLELDIWIPELRLGIEYQGEQHYQVIKHWGGEEGLKRRQENDRKKKALCKQMGHTLIEFHHSEDLTEDIIRKKLARYLALPIAIA